MDNELPRVSTFTVLKNIVKFVQNPIPIINGHFENLGSKSYRISMASMQDALITRDPELAQYILQKNHKNYIKSKIQTELLAEFAGKGLLTSNGAYWLKQRRLIQPGFHKKSLNGYIKIMSSMIENYTNELNSRIESGNTKINVFNEMSNLSIQIVARTLFTNDVDADKIKKIKDGVDILQAALVKNIRQPYLKWYRNVTGETKRNKALTKELYQLILNVIHERKNTKSANDDVLDMLLAARYEGTDEGMSDQQLLDEVLIIFVAGYETTANALTWTLYLLDKNRAELKKLRSECQQKHLSESLTLEDVMSLSYTKQVASEAMRIYPPAWIVDRLPIVEDEYNGVRISKDCVVNIFIYGIHHDPENWIDPEKFDPERFSKENKKNIRPYTYFPFGGGPRLCIGHQFAMMEIQLALYHLLTKFDFTCDAYVKADIAPSVTLRPKYAMMMDVVKLKEN